MCAVTVSQAGLGQHCLLLSFVPIPYCDMPCDVIVTRHHSQASLLQQLHIFPVLRSPGLDTRLQEGPPEGRNISLSP